MLRCSHEPADALRVHETKEGGLAVSCSGLVLLDEASEEQLRNFLILRQKSNTR